MTNNYIIFCDRCFEDIQRLNFNASRLWVELCALRMKEGEFIKIHTQDFPELRYLERLGYVVSTDEPQDVIVRIKGYKTNEEGQHTFCLSRGQHEG